MRKNEIKAECNQEDCNQPVTIFNDEIKEITHAYQTIVYKYVSNSLKL